MVRGPGSGGIGALVLAFSLGGCAACRPYQNVRVESEPVGSTVYLDGEVIGETPLRHRIDRTTDHAVFVKRDGYTPKLVVLELQRRVDGIHFFLPPDIAIKLRRSSGPIDRDLQIELEADPNAAKPDGQP